MIQERTLKSKNKRIILVVLIIILLFGIYNYAKKMPSKAYNSCNADEDCIAVPVLYSDCCYGCGEEAINKNTAAIRKAQQKNCSEEDWKNCPMFECAEKKGNKPACVGRKCTLI